MRKLLTLFLLLPSIAFASPTTQILYQSGSEGSTVYIDYDSSTLVATGLSITVGSHASGPLTFYYSTGGTITSLQANPGTALSTYTFPTPLTGVAGTDPHGNPNISWGIEVFGSGHNLVAPTAPTTVGTATP